jgi:MOSC domain-containing protein YiiM
MKIVSLNVGLPREVVWHGINVTTGIFKQPVEGRIALRELNLDGDRQADLTVHGGAEKVVYCNPLGHYEYWKKQLPGRDLPLGIFGENFTIDFGGSTGAPEDTIHIGDRFSAGSAEVVVTPAAALLQTRRPLPNGRHGEALSCESPKRVLSRRTPRRRSRSGR